MSTSSLPPRQPSHRAESTSWILPVVIVCSLIALVVGAVVIDRIFSEDTTVKTPVFDQPTHPVSAPSTRRPTPTPTVEDLVAKAMKMKPLEDIEKGDRVLYQGHTCRWMSWDKNINTSTIKCPGEKAFQIQTGRLTPVEMRTPGS